MDERPPSTRRRGQPPSDRPSAPGIPPQPPIHNQRPHRAQTSNPAPPSRPQQSVPPVPMQPAPGQPMDRIRGGIPPRVPPPSIAATTPMPPAVPPQERPTPLVAPAYNPDALPQFTQSPLIANPHHAPRERPQIAPQRPMASVRETPPPADQPISGQTAQPARPSIPSSARPSLPSTDVPDRPGVPHNNSDKPSTGNNPLAEQRAALAEEWRQQRQASWKGKLGFVAEKILRGIIFVASRGWKMWVDLLFKLNWAWRAVLVVGTFFSVLLFFGFFLNGANNVVSGESNRKADIAIKTWRAPREVAVALDEAQTGATGKVLEVTSGGVAALLYPSGTIIVKPTRGVRQLTDNNGRVWVERPADSCWNPTKRTIGHTPDVADVLLPLNPARTTWKGAADAPTYSATRLGSWGRGTGTLDITDGKIVAFTYRPAGGKTFEFTVKTRDEVEPPELVSCTGTTQ